MSFTDKIKAKAEELDLKSKAAKAQEVAQKAAHQAAEKAGELADKHGDKVTAQAGKIADKAATAVDAKTGGKYSDKIEKAKGAVVDGVAKGTDKLAEQGSAKAKVENAAAEAQTKAGHTVDAAQDKAAGVVDDVKAAAHDAKVDTQDRNF